MKQKCSKILCAALLLALGAGCTAPPGQQTAEPTATEPGKTAQPGIQETSPAELVPAQSKEPLNRKPVLPEDLKDGVYPITVDSSSSMFRITDCRLTVEGSSMLACMVMSGKGYTKVYMGTGVAAASAPETQFVPYEENEAGAHTFTVPVPALDQSVDCAAFSRKKEQWYDRTLVFRSDALPPEAFVHPPFLSPAELGLEDGSYTVEVTLGGGSGRARIQSPAALAVEDGCCRLTLVWDSSHYDYMKVDGTLLEPLSREDSSVFEIPVPGFDWGIPVVADTTAMGTPHEIGYTLFLDSETLEEVRP